MFMRWFCNYVIWCFPNSQWACFTILWFHRRWLKVVGVLMKCCWRNDYSIQMYFAVVICNIGYIHGDSERAICTCGRGPDNCFGTKCSGSEILVYVQWTGGKHLVLVWCLGSLSRTFSAGEPSSHSIFGYKCSIRLLTLWCASRWVNSNELKNVENFMRDVRRDIFLIFITLYMEQPGNIECHQIEIGRAGCRT